VLLSAFNALTLSPALAALLLRPRKESKGIFARVFGGFNRVFDKATRGYVNLSHGLIRKAIVAVLILVGFTVASGLLGYRLPTSFLPTEDYGYMYVNVQLPPAASMERTDEALKKVEAILAKTTGVQYYTTVSGFSNLSRVSASYQGYFFIALKPWAERTTAELQVQGIADTLNREMAAQVPEANCIALLPPAIPRLGNAGGFSMYIQDRSGGTVEFLDQNLQNFLAAARANLGLARSNQFPQFDVGADLTTTCTSGNSGASASGQAGRKRSVGEVFLSLLSFEIDVWGRLRQQTKAARAQLRSTEEDRKTVTTIVVSDVATGYFNLLELDMELDIAKRTLAVRQESLRLITARQQGGLATMLDVRQAEELVYQVSQTIPDTERLIEQTENQISLLLGNNPGTIPRGTPLAEQQELPVVPAGLPSSLLERRPYIRSAEQLLVAQNALVYAAKAAYFPRISLTGALGFQSDSLANLFSGQSAAWSFVPQLAQPIFTAGRLKSNVNFEKTQREYALAQYQQTIQTAFREVSDALVQYRRLREIRAQQELPVSTLRDYSRLAHLRYDGGVDTLLNALIADSSLFSAELSLAQTRRNELLSLVQLYRALGGGWQQ
jgi:multidrug efflux system outer membrane protein